MRIDGKDYAGYKGDTLASALLAHFVHPNWIWLAAFVGANLFQASFTGFCPLAKVLARLGIKPGAAFGKS